MVDASKRLTNTAFSGLASTVAIMGGVGMVCFTGFETLRQIKRLPRRRLIKLWKRGEQKQQEDSSRYTQEDYEMGHLYYARMFHAT